MLSVEWRVLDPHACGTSMRWDQDGRVAKDRLLTTTNLGRGVNFMVQLQCLYWFTLLFFLQKVSGIDPKDLVMPQTQFSSFLKLKQQVLQ